MPDALTITIVHDNRSRDESLKAAWGLCAFVTGREKDLLFDTGSDGSLLLANLAALQIAPDRIDSVILSHVHPDHTGGLIGLLDRHACRVYLPQTFPGRVKEVVQRHGAAVIEVSGPQQICPDVFTTGLLGRRLREQALVIRTEQGLVVLTGCAHYNLVRMIEQVTQAHGQGIRLVLGGFHLEWATRWRIRKIVDAFKRHDVRYVAPTHCSGETARRLFRLSFGRRHIDAGAGTIVTLDDLK